MRLPCPQGAPWQTGKQINLWALRKAAEEQRAVGGAGGGSNLQHWCLGGSDKEEREPARCAQQGFKQRSQPGRAYRTFWELQGGQGVQKRVPAGKTGVAGADRVAESLLDQAEALRSMERLDKGGSSGSVAVA